MLNLWFWNQSHWRWLWWCLFCTLWFWRFSVWRSAFIWRCSALILLSNHIARWFNFNVLSWRLLMYDLWLRLLDYLGWLGLRDDLLLWWRLRWRLVLLDGKIWLLRFNFTLLELFSNSTCCIWAFCLLWKLLMISSCTCIASFWFLLTHF